MSEKAKEPSPAGIEDPLRTSTLDVLLEMEGHFGKIYAMDWGSDSETLLTASQDGTMVVWDLPTNSKLEVIQLSSSWVMAAAFSPSMNLIASGGLDNTCSIFRLSLDCDEDEDDEPELLHGLTGHSGYVSSIAFLSEQQLVTGSGDMSCALWDIETATRVSEFSEHSGDVMAVDLNTEGSTFISGSCDSTVKLWDLRSGQCEFTFSSCHLADVNDVRYSRDFLKFATGSEDASCKIFDIRAKQELKTFSPISEPSSVLSIDFSGQGDVLFAGLQNSKMIAWDTETGDEIKTFTDHTDSISRVRVSPNGAGIASASWDMRILIRT